MEMRILLIFTLRVLASVNFSTATNNWLEGGSLYQIYPRSWKDGNGDGVGDLKGITENLDFLKEIGINGAWLSPIFKSPMSDFGYDISDFFKIDPIFGSLEDFDALIAKANKIGMKIILDFVPNHSSDECEWFQKSVNREDGYDDFYVWGDGKDDPKNPGKKIPPSNWLSDFGGSAWTWNEKRQQFYLHQFQRKQPDFNYRNVKVHEAMFKVLKYWLDRGVGGFRIDAVAYVYEKVYQNGTFPDEPISGQTTDTQSKYYLKHIYTRDQPENVGLLVEWRRFIDDYQKKNGGDQRVLLAEAYSPINILQDMLGNVTNPGANTPFNFNFITDLNKTSNARDLEASINKWMDVMWKENKTANWVLGNHDNPRIGNRLGKEKKDMFNIINMGLPGTSVTYYGEEIGMDDVPTQCTKTSCDFRDPERTPFQWNDQISAGFSSSNQTWLPVSKDYKKRNVKYQRTRKNSSLNIFKAMQKLKHTEAFKAAFKEDGAFSYGAIKDQVFQIIRRSSSNEEYRILINMGNKVEIIKNLFDCANIYKCLMEYHLVTKYSPHDIGDIAYLNNMYMMPYESVVLKNKTIIEK